MIVVASGVVVRWEPAGFTVVAWHRHDRLMDTGCPDDVYEQLSGGEMVDVVIAHTYNFLPGQTSLSCPGWHQPALW